MWDQQIYLGEVIAVCIPIFSMGLVLGAFASNWLRDKSRDDLLRAQQARGDHWFEKYMGKCRELERIREDWRR